MLSENILHVDQYIERQSIALSIFFAIVCCDVSAATAAVGDAAVAAATDADTGYADAAKMLISCVSPILLIKLMLLLLLMLSMLLLLLMLLLVFLISLHNGAILDAFVHVCTYYLCII